MEGGDASPGHCTVLCLGVPAGTEFGIDYQVWQVGEQFQGITAVPCGVHFVYYSPKEAKHSEFAAQSAPRTGFFVALKKGDVVVWKWDTTQEDLLEVKGEEAARYAAGVRRLDFAQHLGPYPKDMLQQWMQLSSFITPAIVDKLQPLNKKISSLYESTTDSFRGEEGVETHTHRPYFSLVPRVAKLGATLSAEEVTRAHLDRSPVLQALLHKEYPQSHEGLLGELQFAFICFLMGQSFDAFEQWKTLVVLCCSCDRLLHDMPHFFSAFLSVLYFQMQQVPEDFFVDILSGKNFMMSTFKSFFELLNDDTLDQKLKRKAKKLQKWLESKFGCKFGLDLKALQEGEDVDDEDAPAVVQL